MAMCSTLPHFPNFTIQRGFSFGREGEKRGDLQHFGCARESGSGCKLFLYYEELDGDFSNTLVRSM